jgi:hypothetical protein
MNYIQQAEQLIKGAFYFMLKGKEGGKYISRKQVAGKDGKQKWVYDYGKKGGAKASPEKPVKQSKPKADNKGMKNKNPETMSLDELKQTYEKVKNDKGAYPDKVFNLLKHKDIQNIAAPYKEKAKSYISENNLKEGEPITIGKVTISGSSKSGHGLITSSSEIGSNASTSGSTSLSQAVAIALALNDSENGRLKGNTSAGSHAIKDKASYFKD